MDKDEIANEAYWNHQDKLWRQDRVSGGLGYMSANGFVPGSKKDALLYVDHNSPLGRAIIEDRKRKEAQMTASTYEVKPGSMSLFKNDRKETENQPDYKGSGKQLDGTEVWVAAWIKTSATGTKYMSLSITAKEQAAAPTPSPKPLDDSIPFQISRKMI